ncbi:S-adenosyl-L-methionine-dependent methyltransferase [Zalerion maritima]|uniref:mRNA cap guanine-N(7) methyltransferase n=1 Tax=Zalerion maritima TaxID=339359 RepID=A0AAD5RWE4_9PEZI|nr:S-adenosyl-L-methionine-dependent methyltransferase [Zalerion maritima]
MPPDSQQPSPHSTRDLETKKRRRTPSPNGPSKKHAPEGQDDLPQPYNAMELAPAKKIPSEGRKLKRPGQRARITEAEREAIRRRQIEREREMREIEERQRDAERQRSGVNDVVRQHYNAVPERGRDWRRTESHIKGLRAFNNWVKSCVIQRYSPSADFGHPGSGGPPEELLVLDLGCGKGGDLQKWTNAPQPVQLYVGIDTAEISIDQAKDRYMNMGARGGRGRGRPPRMDARFFVMDCFTTSIDQIPIIQDVGFDPTGTALAPSRGFDVVSMMFCMHYAYESEAKARTMLRNVAGALKKGGRFIGTIPNSDVLSSGVVEFNKKMKEKKARKEEKEKSEQVGEEDEKPTEDSDKEEGEADEDEEEEGEAEQTAEWGNRIYRVRFPGETPEDGVFRPPYGWKYNFFLDEAVDQVPEYVVPWEAFRALAEEFNLELQYHEPFRGVWETEKDDRELGMLSERMGVRERGGGPLLVSEQEMAAASFYLSFCFYKV